MFITSVSKFLHINKIDRSVYYTDSRGQPRRIYFPKV